MKTLGMIGGMSWESSVEYYKLINQKVKDVLGGYHSCRCIMYSVEFAEIEELLRRDNWPELDKRMAETAKKLELAGADIIILCTNTVHMCNKAITENISVPFLHIAEATGREIVSKNIKKVGLLGTKYTMEKDFYKKTLADNFNIQVIIPEKPERERLHRIIFDELVHGQVKKESIESVKKIINELENKGAEGIVLGCTELPMIITQKDVGLPLFNTTKIHAEKAAEWIISQ